MTPGHEVIALTTLRDSMLAWLEQQADKLNIPVLDESTLALRMAQAALPVVLTACDVDERYVEDQGDE